MLRSFFLLSTLALTACTTIHAVGGSARPDEFYVVTTKSFLVFTTSPVVLACTHSEQGEPACARVLTGRQAGDFGLGPYEEWLRVGEARGEEDAEMEKDCKPEQACGAALSVGPGVYRGCVDRYRASYDDTTYNSPCPAGGDAGPAPEVTPGPASEPIPAPATTWE